MLLFYLTTFFWPSIFCRWVIFTAAIADPKAPKYNPNPTSKLALRPITIDAVVVKTVPITDATMFMPHRRVISWLSLCLSDKCFTEEEEKDDSDDEDDDDGEEKLEKEEEEEEEEDDDDDDDIVAILVMEGNWNPIRKPAGDKSAKVSPILWYSGKTMLDVIIASKKA
jgi:hypothetical protein